MSISRVTPDRYDAAGAASVDSVPEAVRRVTTEATRDDGRSPLNEAALLSLRHHGLAGKALWVARDDAGAVVGFALAAPAPPARTRAPAATAAPAATRRSR